MESKRLPSKHSNNNREKRVKRKEILEKKKAIDDCIKSASADKDPLASFLPFRSYDRNGLSVHLKAECGDKLSFPIKQYIMSLLKDNMEEPYGSDWPTEEKVKRREMVVPEARYIFVHETPNECSYRTEREQTYMNCIEDKGHIVGFVHYRFTLEEEIPVLYVYELQLEPRVQAKGLGKFLMQLIELVAHKNRMGAVMLTVQKANSLAMNFYLNKLRYVIAAVSPSRVDPLIGVEKSYEILCKTFDHEAKAILEVRFYSICSNVITDRYHEATGRYSL
ncbi:N-alpha-acetyltransferase 40-like isoform X1 [Juglans microcarpa x Juglans regia]|uniref:N-alpha-acetyltransferase 40-like isoform X1 n=1 Tax=Juglans microcarpa x Juglans regia TaxID=2249226 RepID=UPI001B7D95D2|nr:N-alpha-acetyltransferase 40-like isoform X1 [Juglans microcarpa x Juglans regia]